MDECKPLHDGVGAGVELPTSDSREDLFALAPTPTPTPPLPDDQYGLAPTPLSPLPPTAPATNIAMPPPASLIGRYVRKDFPPYGTFDGLVESFDHADLPGVPALGRTSPSLKSRLNRRLHSGVLSSLTWYNNAKNTGPCHDPAGLLALQCHSWYCWS